MAWGRVFAEEPCSDKLLSVQLIVGIGTSVPFTACDDEALPVAHGLPSPTDDRRFTASLGSDGRQLIPTYYVGQGIYEAAVLASTHGTRTLHVELNSTTAGGTLMLLAKCPNTGQKIALATGKLCRLHRILPPRCWTACLPSSVP